MFGKKNKCGVDYAVVGDFEEDEIFHTEVCSGGGVCSSLSPTNKCSPAVLIGSGLCLILDWSTVLNGDLLMLFHISTTHLL